MPRPTAPSIVMLGLDPLLFGLDLANVAQCQAMQELAGVCGGEDSVGVPSLLSGGGGRRVGAE
jgi:hypothetical protein